MNIRSVFEGVGIKKKLNSYFSETVCLKYVGLRKEGNVLFNDTLNTFYLRLYGVTHMIKDYSD